MSNKISRQLAVFLGAEDIKMGTKQVPGKKILYTWIKDDGAQEAREVQYVLGKLDNTSRSVLGALKQGDKFVVVKEEVPNPKDSTKTFWNLKEFATENTYTAKPKSTYKTNFYKNTEKKTGGYDSLGNQIGNSITNAIVSLGAGKTIKEYEERARAIINLGNILRAELESKTSQEPEVNIIKQLEENESLVQSYNQDLTPDDEIEF